MEGDPSCHVFCRVVDNFGDAGVAWRLARQLAHEHGLAVTLYIDDAERLARIAPAVDVARMPQRHEGVAVHRMADADDAAPARIVVEAFGCGLPERYLDAMERSRASPVWINLEYLSAEPWVDGAHALPSPPPRRALSRWFFFPGFTPRTGGLLRERGLFEAREAMLRDPTAQSLTWRALGVETLPPNALTVSLFAYPSPVVAALLRRWADDDEPIVCIVPQGIATDAIEALLGRSVHAGDRGRSGALHVVVAPLVDQRAFDARLGLCALDFVRGEDSFVRAQWAARPLVWQAYPQAGGAHLAKHAAFRDRYASGLAADAAKAWTQFCDAWNAADPAVIDHWPALRSAIPALSRHARAWADALARQCDLASALVAFARERL